MTHDFGSQEPLTKCIYMYDKKTVGAIMTICATILVEFNVFPMGDNLTSGDLSQGHNNLLLVYVIDLR